MKLIFSLFFFASIATAQPYKFIFHRFPDNFKDGDSLVITRDKSERTVDLQAAPFSSVITTQDIKLPFVPQPRKSMQERSHQSAQKVGFWWAKLDSLDALTEADIRRGLLNHPSVNVFLQLYSRYEAECYADSTRNGYDRIAIVGGKRVRLPLGDHYKIAALDPLGCIEIIEHYDHRAPTFPGFIKWLRRQK